MSTASTPPPATRRTLLVRLALGLGGAALVECASIALSFLRPRRAARRTDAATLVLAGRVDDFAPGSVTAVPAGRFYLVRLDDGGFLALHRRCPHLGCTLPWDEAAQRFACPCHGSGFDRHGDVLSPPAPRALDLFPVRLENGLVKVDVSRALERARFDERQVTRS